MIIITRVRKELNKNNKIRIMSLINNYPKLRFAYTNLLQKEEYSLTQAANPSYGLDFEGQLNKRTEG